MSKSFIANFEKDFGIKLQTLPDDKILKSNSPRFELTLFTTKNDKTLYVIPTMTKRINPRAYEKTLRSKGYLKPGVFVVIYKSKRDGENETFYVDDRNTSHYDRGISGINDNDNILLQFRNTTIRRSDVDSVINRIWGSLENISDNERLKFINLVICLLSRDDIKVYKNYSLSELIQGLNDAISSTPFEIITKEQIELGQAMDIKIIYKGFETLFKDRCRCDANGLSECDRKALEQLELDLKRIFEGNSEGLIKCHVMDIYDNIFCKMTNTEDIGDLCHAVETKYLRTEAKLGQIFTPKLIWNLALYLYGDQFKNDSVILDPTAGSGNFTLNIANELEKNENNKCIIYQNDIDAGLADMIRLRGLCLYKYTTIRTFNYSCFNPVFKSVVPPRSVDFLFMNPPFGISNGKNKQPFPPGFKWDGRDNVNCKMTEWTFIRYNMETFCKEGAKFLFVIPISCVSENKQNTKDKHEFLQCVKLEYVITVREDIFAGGGGSKAVCLLVGTYYGGQSFNHSYKTL